MPSLPKVTVNLLGSGTEVVPCASSIDWMATSCQLVPSSVNGSGEAHPEMARPTLNATAGTSHALGMR